MADLPAPLKEQLPHLRKALKEWVTLPTGGQFPAAWHVLLSGVQSAMWAELQNAPKPVPYWGLLRDDPAWLEYQSVWPLFQGNDFSPDLMADWNLLESILPQISFLARKYPHLHAAVMDVPRRLSRGFVFDTENFYQAVAARALEGRQTTQEQVLQDLEAAWLVPQVEALSTSTSRSCSGSLTVSAGPTASTDPLCRGVVLINA